MRRVATWAIALGLGLPAAGCGGPMKPSELADSLQTIGSSAAEGALLARHAAQDRTKTTFTRVRARELAEVLAHEVEKLSDAEPQPGLGASLDRAVRIADDAAAQLDALAATPADRAAALGAQRRLGDAAGRARDLEATL